MPHKLNDRDITRMYKESLKTMYNVDPDASLFRYMDLSKFIDLLVSKSIYIARADEFEDPMEGDLPEWLIKNKFHIDFMSIIFKKLNNSNYDKINRTKEINDLYQQMRKKTFISCWNLNEEEDYALWKIYAKKDGIAIKTTARKLKSRLSSDSFLFKVHYLSDDRKEAKNLALPPKEPLDFYGNPFVIKRKAYKYENEVRAIWFDNNCPEKQRLKIGRLSNFIDEIYVNPFSPDWFLKSINELLKKFNMTMKAKKSRIKINN